MYQDHSLEYTYKNCSLVIGIYAEDRSFEHCSLEYMLKIAHWNIHTHDDYSLEHMFEDHVPVSYE